MAQNMNQKKEEYVKIPSELLRQIDELVDRVDFGSREAFVEAAVRRLIDHYRVLQAEEPAKDKSR